MYPCSLISFCVVCCLDSMSLVMKNLAFCICRNKGTDQQRGNCTADQRLCFRHIDSTSPQHPTPLAIFCGCAVQFVSDLVRNSEDRFSHDAASMIQPCLLIQNFQDWLASVEAQAGFTMLTYFYVI